jgi:DNA-3-methyladenine glycosylase
MIRLKSNYYSQDVLTIAPDLLGKCIVRVTNGVKKSYIISEVEAYRGEDDLACHASKGRTNRTEIMYHMGGRIYVYLIYGIYWMFNIVTGTNNNPQAVLLRGLLNCTGPGRVGRLLEIDKSFYGEDLTCSDRIWIANNENKIDVSIITSPRVGIDYAGEFWKNKPWRFTLDNY